MGQLDEVEGGPEARIVIVSLGTVWIAQNLAQAAQRQIGLLRQEQDTRSGGQSDSPAAERPKAGQNTEERGLATTGRALKHDPLATVDLEVQILEDHLALRQPDLGAIERQGVHAGRREVEALIRGLRLLRSRHGIGEGRQTVDGRLPACQIGERADEPG